MPSFTNDLLKWYRENKRDLPWRKTSDPYSIWLSEIMLQQTQVATVIGYYNRFLEKFPTVDALANASEEDVYKLWEGLGYYSRARNLMRCARQVVEEHNGRFPASVEALKKLSGIGPYTAGAVASIAFDVKAHAVDGNVMRVISRLDEMGLDISDPKNRVYFENRVLELMEASPGDFNQGLMELGATICKPTNPICRSCPVNSHCKAYENGSQKSYPYKKPKAEKKKENIAVIIVKNQEKILIVKRGPDGLLSNLWGFPSLEVQDHGSSNNHLVQEFLEETFSMRASYIGTIKGKRHIFTHRIWTMDLYIYELESVPEVIEDPQVAWVDSESLMEYAIPTAFKKLLNLL